LPSGVFSSSGLHPSRPHLRTAGPVPSGPACSSRAAGASPAPG